MSFFFYWKKRKCTLNFKFFAQYGKSALPHYFFDYKVVHKGNHSNNYFPEMYNFCLSYLPFSPGLQGEDHEADCLREGVRGEVANGVLGAPKTVFPYIDMLPLCMSGQIFLLKSPY